MFKAVLLDMNGTFMFGEDRFGPAEDFSICYRETAGRMNAAEVNQIIRKAHEWLDRLYPDPEHRDTFPSLEDAIQKVSPKINENEIQNLVDTFTHHELGKIPTDYAEAIIALSQYYRLGVVIDIWSPKHRWLDEFGRAGIRECFTVISFSSDIGIVKPSPKPFLAVLEDLGVPISKSVVIGDSVRRDLGGATAAGIPCILVGGANDARAFGAFESLLDIVRSQDLGR